MADALVARLAKQAAGVQLTDVKPKVLDCSTMSRSEWADIPVKPWGSSRTVYFTVVMQKVEDAIGPLPDLDRVAKAFDEGALRFNPELGLRCALPRGVGCDLQLMVKNNDTDPPTFSIFKLIRFHEPSSPEGHRRHVGSQGW